MNLFCAIIRIDIALPPNDIANFAVNFFGTNSIVDFAENYSERLVVTPLDLKHQILRVLESKTCHERAWEPNFNWRDLPTPEEGDVVQLKHSAVFSHLLKAIVTSASDGEVSAVVEAIFDWEGFCVDKTISVRELTTIELRRGRVIAL